MLVVTLLELYVQIFMVNIYDEFLLYTCRFFFIAYTCHMINTGGVNPCEKTQVDHWLSFAIGPLGSYHLKEDALSYLDNILMTNTWLVSKKLTIADIHIFCVLVDKKFLTQFEKKFINITRWYKQMLSLPTVTEVLLSVKKNAKLSSDNNASSEKTITKQIGQRKQEGKFINLPGAEMGKVSNLYLKQSLCVAIKYIIHINLFIIRS